MSTACKTQTSRTLAADSAGHKPPMAEQIMQQEVDQLQHCYRQIHQQRMQDVPILNPNLQVQAVGFREWQNSWLGVLITPWFINLIRLPHAFSNQEKNKPENDSVSPADQSRLEDLGDHNWAKQIGKTQLLALPAGGFTFLTNFDEQIGYYQSCSLMSPVLSLETQQVAIEVADQAMLSIFTAPEVPADIDNKTNHQACTSDSNTALHKDLHSFSHQQSDEALPDANKRAFLKRLLPTATANATPLSVGSKA